MPKFKEALERGKQAGGKPQGPAGEAGADIDAPVADFESKARAWLNDVVIATLKAAQDEVAGELTVEIDTGPLHAKGATPSVRFQIYKKQKQPKRVFTASVQAEGGVLVSALGVVAKDAGNIGDRSDERFSNLVAELIEDVAKST